MKQLWFITLTLFFVISFDFEIKAQCPLTQAIDFIVTDCHGTEVHLFDILDGGQYVLIDFFFDCGPCQQTTPKVVESYYAMGCNMHDVFYMEISDRDSDAVCQTWCQNYGVEYPTIGGPAGGSGICNIYQIRAFPTVILIAPDRSIVINDLWPIDNAQSVIIALEQHGLQQHNCNTYYYITATANPTNGGSVTGGGTYAQGSTCTLHATANSGYSFVKWTKNGTQVSTNPTYSFTVTGNAAYVAHFEQNPTTYTVTATASPTGSGFVEGQGTYVQGSTCTLHANANSGYSFVKWTKNGTQVSTNPTYSFTVTGNAAYIAHFEQSPTTYTVTATASPTGSGFVEGQGTYVQGSTCTLSATPNGNYSFEKWVKDGTQVSTNPTYSFTVTSNANCTAYFVPTYTITATANPTTGGSVTGGGTYAQGSTCTLRATPNNGYSFVNWTKNGVQVSTNLDYNFTVTGSEAFVANFERDPVEYTITVNADPAAGGTVSGGGTYTEGSTCVISAMPNSGYVFENWTLNGAEVSINPSYSFIVRRNATYIAHFAQNANQATITATANPVEGGAVSGGGTYELGTTCTLNAVAATGYEFVKWTQDGNTVSTEATFSFTVTSNAVYVAHFNKLVNNYTVSVSLEPSQSAGSVIGAGTYEEGASCTLIAIANPTFTFVSWTENGAVVSTDDHYTFTVERNRSLVAVFSQGLFYTITASAGANGAITPEGEIIVEPGQDKTFAIIPDNGCLVSKVLVDGVDIGPVESYTFRSVNANHSIRAQFSGLGVDDNISLNLKIYPNPANDKINIESPNMKRVSIFNLFGIQIESKDVKDDHTAFSTVNLPQGTYILKVENNDGRIGWSQFVVVK